MGFRSFAFFFFKKKATFKTLLWRYSLCSHYLNCQLPLKVAFWFGQLFCHMPVKNLLNYLTVLLLARIQSTTSKWSLFFIGILNSGNSKYIIIHIAVNYGTHIGIVVSFYPLPFAELSVLRVCMCLWVCKYESMYIP